MISLTVSITRWNLLMAFTIILALVEWSAIIGTNQVPKVARVFWMSMWMPVKIGVSCRV